MEDMQRQAMAFRGLQIPGIDREEFNYAPFGAFLRFIQAAEDILGEDHWFLLALDEYEKLEKMVQRGGIDDRIFDLLRSLIQSHPNVTLLLSGTHTLAEMPPHWSDAFINVRVLHVQPLTYEEARELILEPLPDWPLDYPQQVIDYLYEETGGHPNWLQESLRTIVDGLNDEGGVRVKVTLKDAQDAVARVPESLSGDFTDLWMGADATDEQRAVMTALANAEKESLTPDELADVIHLPLSSVWKALNFLAPRGVLLREGESFCIRARLLKRWIRRHSTYAFP